MRSTTKGFRRNIKIVSVLLCLSLFFSLALGEGIAEAGVSRIGGADRYETSALTSRDVYPSAATVIIARGDPAGHFADGLAASVLAGVLDAPVLLTTPGALPNAIKNEIKRLGATRAYVLGGTGAIAEGVDKTLRDMGLVVTRIAGTNRYDTAAKIAQEANRKGTIKRYAFLVNGSATADSLVAGPAALRDGIPILLVRRGSIPEETKNMLKSLGISQVYIVGGTAVIGSSLESALTGLATIKKRLAGADRYGTSLRVAEEFFPNKGDALLVSGLDRHLADSIGACVYRLPILYVKKDTISQEIYNFLGRILGYGSTARIIGGPAAVSRSVESVVEGLLAGSEGRTTYKVKNISIITDPVDVTALDNKAPVEVTLSTATSRANIYYTLDGTDPTSASTPYSNPFTVTTDKLIGETVTVKAIGFKSGYSRSAIASKEIVFETKTSIVTFDAQEGTVSPGTKKVTYDALYGELPVPVRTGYSFNGWFTAASGGDPVTAETVVTESEDHTLYAQWTANSYTVSFDAQGGTPDPDDQPVTFGSPYGTLPAVSREGYTFNGWFTAVTGGDQITTGTAVAIAGNHTLYARWGINQYTINFDSNGGSPVASITQNYGTAVDAPDAPQREGYTFDGWNPALPTTMPANNLTVTAQWTANDYTVSFDAQGGTPDPDDQPVTFGSPYGALPAVSREGHTFNGWFTAVTGGDQITTGTAVAIAGNHTLYARWGINQYTINFDSNGGSPVASITQNYGTAVDAPDAPQREGYTFDGWNPALPATMPANNLTVTAQWTANDYTVSFDAQGGTPAPGDQSVTFGSPYGTLPAVSREGHTFNGWFTAASGGDQITTGTAVAIAGNHTLYAQWIEAELYTITFNSNGGSPVDPVALGYGATIIPPADPTKAGHDFMGWNPALPATMPANDLTVTAQWSGEEVTITFDPHEGTVNPTTKTVYYRAPYGELPTPTRTGYTFDGWHQSGTGNLVTAEDIVWNNAPHVLHAYWIPNQYSVTLEPGMGRFSTTLPPRIVTFGFPYGEMPTPTRFGHDFSGWFTEETGGIEITGTSLVETAADHSLYARWTMQPLILTKPAGTDNVVAVDKGGWGGEVYFDFDDYTYVWRGHGDNYRLRIVRPDSLLSDSYHLLFSGNGKNLSVSGWVNPIWNGYEETLTVQIGYRPPGEEEVAATFQITIAKSEDDNTVYFIVTIP